MRSAVLGSTGQLGRELCQQQTGEVHPFLRSQIDLNRPDTFHLLRELRPDIVFNCAAYNHVDRAESEPEVAFAVNAFGVRQLALLCRDLDCTLVHFSSDHVFGLDQTRRTSFLETDAPGPVNVYGCSKLAGEHFVRAFCPRHFVIRTCGLYGPPSPGGKGRNFVNTMLRLAADGRPIRVVDDQTCTPTYCADLAAAMLTLSSTERFGLYHLTNAGACTWFEFARAIFDLAGIHANLTAITSREFGALARRPAYSVLGTGRNEVPSLRPWRESLSEFLSGEAPKE